MKTKLLVATALTAVLSTGLYAECNEQGMKNGEKPCGMKNGKHMMKKGHMMMKKAQKGPMTLLKQLNLTLDQKKQIGQIKRDLMKKTVTPNIAFTSTSFDKAKFIQIMKDKRDNKIEKKAELMEKVYNVLTPKQKEQFKVLMDLKQEKRALMMEKRMNHKENRS